MDSTMLPIAYLLSTMVAILVGMLLTRSRPKKTSPTLSTSSSTNDSDCIQLSTSASTTPEVTPTSTPTNHKTHNLTKLRVVLDLDECLVHVDKTGTIQSSQNGLETFTLLMKPDLVQFRVYLRPGWKDLLMFLAQNQDRYEVHVFTASEPNYAKPIVAELERRIKLQQHLQAPLFSQCWFRDSCRRRTYLRHSFTFKDLHVLFGPNPLPRTVLVDDDPTNFTDNPDQGIPVKPFRGSDPWDDSLERVVALLQELESVPDVRPVLRERFGVAHLLQYAQDRYPKFVPSQWEFVMNAVQPV